VVDGIRYSTREKLEGGAFADLYKVEHNGTLYACKMNRNLKTTEDLRSLLCETLIHILLLQASVGKRHGPFVPYLYKVGYDSTEQRTYVITEWMSHTLDDEIVRHSKAENDVWLPIILRQVALALSHFGTTLQFNHRDLHTQNVMIARDVHRDVRRVVLIDFGYSCLTWHGLSIKGPSLYNDNPHLCYKKDRDMPFLCMRLYKFYDRFLSDSLRNLIHTIIQGTVRDKPCDMGALCPEYGLSDIGSQYEFLNHPEVRVPLGTAESASRAFQRMRIPRTRRAARNFWNEILGTHKKQQKQQTRRRTKLPRNTDLRII